MTDVERAVLIGNLLWEAKALFDSGVRESPRMSEIFAEANRLHAEMSQETLDYFAAQDFVAETPLHGIKGGGL